MGFFDKIDNNTIVDALKDLFKGVSREIFSAYSLQLSTFTIYSQLQRQQLCWHMYFRNASPKLQTTKEITMGSSIPLYSN